MWTGARLLTDAGRKPGVQLLYPPPFDLHMGYSLGSLMLWPLVSRYGK